MASLDAGGAEFQPFLAQSKISIGSGGNCCSRGNSEHKVEGMSSERSSS